ncbi:myosin-binding protein 7-like [Abrus precatorius]|uniref:Myosin-binding protein 7-like n=1 Tax=Abrus precatorius TaxID=3816 RepID=A0A8B8JKV3_ABRPR|nr:myosin-binding protein 7-like [Abrus precatorius]XP_027331879.1 myosin-binding protein 7-like [Abrus precatorius]
MVETNMAESDITAMKETLRAQQQLLQKLYAELDTEREASATAASEAMDMILRLQGEKAAVKMEASHYKRMAEEKIGHAEATLEVFEELMYQKEMEIASLEFQVLAYKHKLLTLGSDFNASDFEFSEDLLLSRDDDQHNEENGQSSTVRRLNSLPPIQFKNTMKAARKRERSPSPIQVQDVLPKIVESTDQEVTLPNLDLPRKSVDCAYETLDEYWKQIRNLDEKVKVISDSKESGGEKYANLRSRRGRSCSIFSQVNTKITCDQTDRVLPTNSDKVNSHDGTQDRKAVASPSCSVNVHDVFEVPQTSEKFGISEHGKRRLVKWISDADNRLTKPDSVSEEIIESHVKHDMDKLKSMLNAHHETKIPSPKDMRTIVWQKKEGMDVDCNAQAEFQKLHQRIDQLEREKTNVRQEIIHEGDREEHLRLLNDIYSQLKLMQSEMRSWKTQKAAPKEEIPLGPLQEAMVYFWI